MKLTSIEAVRYGALENTCLGELSGGLTVVLGPNESGKSTLTALTRHALYGFPAKRAKGHGYEPAAGGRVVRLSFADDTGEWVIERAEAKNRGLVTVAARRGPERPELLGELVGGVSEQTYRVVFGFGLDELKEIEHGDNADIVSRFYAASAGLAENPMDVRDRLEAAANELYAPRAQKPVVNSLASRMKDAKSRIAALEAQASEYAAEQARLTDLTQALAPLRERRDTLDARLLELEQDSTRLKAASEGAEELDGQLREADASIADAESAVAMIDVDERALALAPELSTILDDTSAFRGRLDALAAAETTAEEAERRATSNPLPAGVQDSPGSRAAVENRRTQLAVLVTRAEATRQAALQAEALAASTEQVSAASTQPVASAPSKTAPVVLSIAAILVGAVFAVVGLATSQLFASLLGVIVLVGGIATLVLTLVRKGPVVTVEPPLTIEAARLRADAMAKQELAVQAAGELEASNAEWHVWLQTTGLDAHGEDPAAVAVLLDELAERQRLLVEAQRFRENAKRERDAAEAWVLRLVDVVRRYDNSAGQIPPLSEATALAARAKRDLETARGAASERAQLTHDIEVAQAARRQLAGRLDAARAVIRDVALASDLEEASALAQIRALLERTREELAEAREAFERVAKEHGELTGKLNNEGRDGQMAMARQELEGLRCDAKDAADRYLTASLAVRLLDSARERYERDQQPEVMRTAGRVFAAMTGGRYTGVLAPLDLSGISAVRADGAVRSSATLSRGTAEQLYLALRVGLIGSRGTAGAALPVLMDDVVVNFDPERRSGAVAAVAELSALHQVLFFTCHPETADALVASVAGVKLLSLDRCEMR